MTPVLAVAAILAVVPLGVGRSRYNAYARAQRSRGRDSIWVRNIGSRSVTGWRKGASLAAGVAGLGLVLAGASTHGTTAAALFVVGGAAIMAGYGLRMTAR
jgi:hypothetical protein